MYCIRVARSSALVVRAPSSRAHCASARIMSSCGQQMTNSCTWARLVMLPTRGNSMRGIVGRRKFRTSCFRSSSSSSKDVIESQVEVEEMYDDYEDDSSAIDFLLANNKAWVKEMNEKDPNYFANLPPSCECCDPLTGVHNQIKDPKDFKNNFRRSSGEKFDIFGMAASSVAAVTEPSQKGSALGNYAKSTTSASDPTLTRRPAFYS